MKIGFWIIIISVITGQITRIAGLGVLTDLLIPLYLGFWVSVKLIKKESIPFRPILIWMIIFLGYLLGALFLKIDSLPTIDGYLGSLLYWVRLASYSGMILPVIDMLDQDKEEALSHIWWSFFVTGTIISLLGFIQLLLFPDFSFMAQYGWDPHQGRLLSTWYDPNFLGGFLGMALVIVIARIVLVIQQQRPLSWLYLGTWCGGIGMMGMALILTYSRSALLAFLIGIGVLTLMISRKALLISLIILIAAIGFSPRLQQRIEGALNLDVTASLRIQNWIDTIEDIERSPILGIGYNTVKYQTILPSTLNSASGRDSSLLTLWLTGGIIGLLIFVGMLISKLIGWLKQGLMSDLLIEKSLAFGAIAAWSLILVHSVFVNSIFFPHILVFLILLLAL